MTTPLKGQTVFKKTDSALRGHVVAELTTLMKATGYPRAVYIPANPTKGRIIRDGIYYINGTPIHETAFSYDPEFPAHSSDLNVRFPTATERGIIMPDAESMDDIRRMVVRYSDGQTLFAGAADLFAVLTDSGNSTMSRPSAEVKPSSVLILCGSTQSRPLNLGVLEAPMPREVYDGSTALTSWDTAAYDKGHSIILTIPYTHRTGKEVAVHLRTVMAEMTRRLVAVHCPDHLIIDGGATAWATLQVLGWTEFEIVCQIAPGVVQMKSVTTGSLVTLKPGSYPWGGLFG